ncbi:lck-interacting transmembrane adapter 1 isoform X2 [Dromaius novaehollandiae]|uniref:lck-interacting transmembrane adapter 1 isoform X2 n=1 Tax=Dromaius novaehollandiae TaxID=8790 RepID=UPI00311DD039
MPLAGKEPVNRSLASSNLVPPAALAPGGFVLDVKPSAGEPAPFGLFRREPGSSSGRKGLLLGQLGAGGREPLGALPRSGAAARLPGLLEPRCPCRGRTPWLGAHSHAAAPAAPRLVAQRARRRRGKRPPMAAVRGEGLPGPPLLPAVAPLALLGGLVYLGALCAACRRGRKKTVPADGVKLAEQVPPRPAPPRSLSRSDTRLHELCRLKPADEGAPRPVSVDSPLAPGGGGASPWGSGGLPRRELPRVPAPEQTYSNLPPAPPRRPRGPREPEEPAAPSPAASADYACVRKARRPEPGDGARREPAGLRPGDGHGSPPPALPPQVEDMYSTVCKGARRKPQDAAGPPRAVGQPGPRWPRCPEPAAALEPCYETLGRGGWPSPARGPEPHYEAVGGGWGQPRGPEPLYESVGDAWDSRGPRSPPGAAPNGLEVYVTNL